MVQNRKKPEKIANHPLFHEWGSEQASEREGAAERVSEASNAE